MDESIKWDVIYENNFGSFSTTRSGLQVNYTIPAGSVNFTGANKIRITISPKNVTASNKYGGDPKKANPSIIDSVGSNYNCQIASWWLLSGPAGVKTIGNYTLTIEIQVQRIMNYSLNTNGSLIANSDENTDVLCDFDISYGNNSDTPRSRLVLNKNGTNKDDLYIYIVDGVSGGIWEYVTADSCYVKIEKK